MAAIAVPADTLPVRAVFGPTIQGEGPMIGRLSAFVRLGGCNLHCPRCDTTDTWDTATHTLAQLQQLNPARTAQQVLADLMALCPLLPPLVVLTGGEPLLHQRSPVFAEILTGLPQDCTVQVETNGTIPPVEHERALYYVVSPKVSGPMAAGDPQWRRIKAAAIARFAELAHSGRASFKFVCADEDDVAAAAQFCDDNGIDAARHAYVMPEGATFDVVMATHQRIMPAITQHRLNTTTRLHLALDMP
jgi:7-carboxy-7-deazaguanine synthase